MKLLSKIVFGKLQYFIPEFTITRLLGKFASLNLGKLTTKVIRWYIGHYGIDMSEAENSDPTSYKTFQDFFTRPLLAASRPLASSAIVCPVDGVITQFGDIDSSSSFEAKGSRYSAAALLGGDSDLADQFNQGSFSVFYLSPGDYHRVHMPCEGRLRRMIYVPGKLFSVNAASTASIPQLFSRNERVVCLFDSERGPFAVVLIGAAIVGGISTVWHGTVNVPHSGSVFEKYYDSQSAVTLKKGEEMGAFLLGSTVIVMLSDGMSEGDIAVGAEQKVRMGEMFC